MSRYTAPGFAEATWLVALREVGTRLRSKAFLVSTGILVLFVLGGVIAGGLLSQNPSFPKVAAAGDAVAIAEASGALDVVEATSEEEAIGLVRDGEVDAAVTVAGDPPALTVTFLDSASMSIVAALSTAPAVDILEPGDQDGLLVYFVAIGFGIIFMVSAMTFGMAIAQSVVEEKQTRVVEILMSTIPVRTLLAGKVLGNTILAFGQIVLIAGVAGIGMYVSGQSVLLGDLGVSLIWFVVFFVVGFVLLATLYAATAALVARQEDVAQVTTPVTYLIMIPYFLVIFFNDNPLVLGIMSYVPFSAPVGMPMRIFLGHAAWWEPLLSLAIILLTAAIVLTVGERMYRNSLLRTGGRVKLVEALRGYAA